MKNFMDENFLLHSETAKNLYHNYAKNTPIIDYHCHINPDEILEDRQFDNIATLWLGADHYKWRQMRWAGVAEKYITGDGTDREKFDKFAEIMPMLAGSPVYHWSHLEAQRYFGFTKPISKDTADELWDLSLEVLKNTSARKLIKASNVKLLCTTDDPADSLSCHKALLEDRSFDVSVLPAWRPEKAMKIDDVGFVDYLSKLSDVAGVTINSYGTLKEALLKRMDYFSELGCKTSDHSLDCIMFNPATEEEVESIFKKALSKSEISLEEKYQYLTALMLFLGKEYTKRNWVMQIHFGVIRNCNTQRFNSLGADSGFDSISNYTSAKEASLFLDALAISNALPKTVLYSLNPGDFTTLGALLGCYQDDSIPGKMQLGSAWWFHDTFEGMTEQIKALASQGALGTFVGMLTDSRSFVSYPRHEYFRRILCNIIGEWVENGEYTSDPKALETLIYNICYGNTLRYFGFSL